MKDIYNFNDLIEIMEQLRSDQGCPWDREQTHESLKQYLVEETYEVLEAIDLKDNRKISEELGDVLFQVIFHAQLAKERGDFDINTIIDGVCKKMVSRHPHVFSDAHCDTASDVSNMWDKIKQKEHRLSTTSEALNSVPSNLPALMRANKVQQKAAKVGFDWDNIEDVYDKVSEELSEVKEAANQDDLAEADHVTEELGDLLFSVVNLSRFLKVHPEQALTVATNKFIQRFELVETQALKSGRNLSDMTLAEMDGLWDQAKVLLNEDDID